VRQHLDARGIDSRPVFYPIHLMPFYQETMFHPASLVNSLAIAREGISLPTFIGLKEHQIGYIVSTLIEACENYR